MCLDFWRRTFSALANKSEKLLVQQAMANRQFHHHWLHVARLGLQYHFHRRYHPAAWPRVVTQQPARSGTRPAQGRYPWRNYLTVNMCIQPISVRNLWS